MGGGPSPHRRKIPGAGPGISRFVYKILNFENSPTGIKSILINKCTINTNYSLRNKNEFVVPFKVKFNDYMEKTFDYFASNL